ncbi:MAG: DHHA1 domain-containing protein [Vicinamibacterales bacterium]
MTERLYYIEPDRLEFDATIVDVMPSDRGWLVSLDRTAFYPTSGGQPHDTGELGGVRVVDVEDSPTGLLHVLEHELAKGSAVTGRIDEERRRDHMQQHTGQHVLSAAFDRCCQARTESFHLGVESSTIDLGREVTPAEIAEAENEANRVIWENRPVTIRFASAEEAMRLPLRKEPPREGTLRLIDIADFDLSACGGTHVARTGEVGTLVVRRSERVRGGTRVEFVCGSRTLTAFRALRDEVDSSLRLLSVGPREVTSAIERLLSAQKDLRRTLKTMATKLAAHEAVTLAAQAALIGDVSVVLEGVDGFDAADLKTLASTIVTAPGRAAVLLSTGDGALVVCARSSDVTRVDANAVLRRLTAQFGGKGGGRPDMAQGGGLTGDRAAILALARTVVAEQLGVTS